VKPLRRIGERVREVNWKNAMDNYVDALHIPVAHPGLGELIGSTYRLEIDRGVYKIYGDLDTLRSDTPSNRAYCSFLPKVDHLPEDRQRLWTYYKLWPSLAFDVYPDQIDFMQFIPLTPTSCLLRESAYALDDSRREMKAARYLNGRINRSVNLEDKGLIERVQDGMASSSFDQGPLGKTEICLRDFAERMRQTIPLSAEPRRPSRVRLESALIESRP
jgi:phenylpropionate dioxygenase-like ring-hydroxylating dioxygenase large terminal subunit